MIHGKRAWWYKVEAPQLFNRNDIIWIDLSPKLRGWHWVLAHGEGKAILVEKLSWIEIGRLRLRRILARLKK